MVKKLFIFTVVLISYLTFTIEHCYAQWQPDVRLTNDPGSSYTSENNAWCIAAYGNVVHAVWADNRDGINGEIYYKRSTNLGLNWEPDTRLTNDTSSSYTPSIAVYGSIVHVVWQDNRNGNVEIYYKRSTDNGFTWSADTRLTNSIGYSRNPSIAVSASNVNIVWDDNRDGNYEIYYKRSTDGGVNWEADTRLTNNTSSSGSASITAVGLFVHIVWYDNRDGNNEIYYKLSTNSGLNWGADTRLTYNTDNSIQPSIAVAGSLVHVLWADYRYNVEIFYKRSTDGGMSWGDDIRLTNNSGNSWYPSIAISGSFMNIVWSDNSDGNFEIYYKHSTNNGLIWGNDTRLTNNTAVSINPSIANSGSNLHVVWTDSRDGNNEIYYKRNPTGNPTNIQIITSEIPTAFSLEQNYPNPFNPITNIKFQIAKSGNVKLIVFDILGKEVATLVNESLQPGTYETTFDASNLTSGIYFYRLQTDKFVETKKMSLIK